MSASTRSSGRPIRAVIVVVTAVLVTLGALGAGARAGSDPAAPSTRSASVVEGVARVDDPETPQRRGGTDEVQAPGDVVVMVADGGGGDAMRAGIAAALESAGYQVVDGDGVSPDGPGMQTSCRAGLSATVDAMLTAIVDSGVAAPRIPVLSEFGDADPVPDQPEVGCVLTVGADGP